METRIQNKRKYFILILLLLSGVVLNFFAPRLFMGFNYLLGSIPVIIVLRFYGIWWGTLAGIIAGSWTYVLFGHPYAMVWLTVEPLFIGLALRYTSIRNLVLLNTLYWPIIGIPLLWIFFKFVMGLPFVGTLPAALMFWLIGITNSLAATNIMQFTPLAQWIEEKDEYRIVTMRQAAFSMMLSLVVFPAIIIMVLNGRAIMVRNEHNIVNQVHEVAKRYNQQIDLLLKPPLLIWSDTGLEHIPDQKAQINIEYVKKYLSELEKDESNNWMTLLDSKENIIFTNTPRFLNQSVYTQDKLSQPRFVQKGIEHILPPMPEYITLWRRVQKSWYKYESSVRNDMGWKLVIEIPFAPFQTSLLEQQTMALQVVLFLCLAALAASLLISYRFNRSILELAHITTGLADRVEKDKTITWPKSRLGEVKALSDNFRHVADTLKLKFRQLRQSHESLEEKVNERTLALHTAKEQAERVYRLMPSALFAVDQDRQIIIWNKKAEQITGYCASEIVGQKCTLFSAEPCITECRLDSDEQIPAEGIQCSIICKDGSKIAISKNIDYLMDGTGNIIGGIESFEDITQKMRLEEQLRQAQKMESIGTLAGGIAHDFNNILFPILGQAEMLIEDASLDKKVSLDGLKQIYTSALRAKDLVQQILTFSRHEHHDVRPIKIQIIIKEVINLLNSTIPKNIEIKHFIDPDCRTINADPTQIHQILMNLTTNAWHAMGHGEGELRIHLKEVRISNKESDNSKIDEGLYACLTIADTGSGMPPDLIKKIFDPFFTTKEKGKGTGIGLSVVHGIVKGLKGHINVHSELDQGTEFKLYFPVNDSALQNNDTESVYKTSQRGTEHIMIVDDEEAIIQMEKQALEHLGYRVRSKSSPIGALDDFQRSPYDFDLVVTDMSMPKMSGDKLASELLKIRPDIPIIMCTGFSEDFTQKKAQKMGIKEVIMKPVLIQNLSGKIRNILDQKIKSD